jgi:hypothetical protein
MSGRPKSLASVMVRRSSGTALAGRMLAITRSQAMGSGLSSSSISVATGLPTLTTLSRKPAGASRGIPSKLLAQRSANAAAAASVLVARVAASLLGASAAALIWSSVAPFARPAVIVAIACARALSICANALTRVSA